MTPEERWYREELARAGGRPDLVMDAAEFQRAIDRARRLGQPDTERMFRAAAARSAERYHKHVVAHAREVQAWRRARRWWLVRFAATVWAAALIVNHWTPPFDGAVWWAVAAAYVEGCLLGRGLFTLMDTRP